MHKHILVLILLYLCILFRIDEVLGQTKEPKQFDLNKSPPREEDSEMDGEQQQTNENRNREERMGQNVIGKVEKGGRKPNDESQKAYAREKARQWRKEFRERKESGKLTKKDLISLEKSKLRKEKYKNNHKEELKIYYSNYYNNNFKKRTAAIKKWRMEHPEKVKEYEKRYRSKNPDKIRARNLKYRLDRLKREREQNLKEQNCSSQEST